MSAPTKRSKFVFSAAAVATFFSSSVATSVAMASPAFPRNMQSHLSAATEPECGVCHGGGVTRRGTVTTPFGVAMVDRGLVKRDNNSLTNALDSLAAEGTDSDADSITDVAELVAGTDPNYAPGEQGALPIQYGCTVSRRGDASHPWVAMVLPLAVLLFRKRRRKPTAR